MLNARRSLSKALPMKHHRRGLHDIRIQNSLTSNPSAKLDFLIEQTQKHPNNDTMESLPGRSSPRTLRWYSCGPTVYDDAHLGHARTYVCTDIIRRILQDFFHIPIDFALGITDVDDKIIARARASKQADTWQDMTRFARPFEDSFFDDMDALGIRRPNAILRVSEHMREIEAYVGHLRNHGSAYDVPGEGVYFDTQMATDYGKLGGLPPLPNTSSAKSSVNVSVDTAQPKSVGQSDVADEDEIDLLPGKRNFRDFALWKLAKPGEPFYISPLLGDGRPGWHIECSAMTHTYFGARFDLHSGGVDLRFPHHTNEIAQAEAHALAGTEGTSESTQDWVRIWLHTGHLFIQGLKMSKSLKNFISVRDFISESTSPHPATDFRIFCLQHRYSSSLHFSPDRVHEAGVYRDRLTRLLDLADAVKSAGVTHTKPTPESSQLTEQLHKCQQGLRAHLAADFNTAAALNDISSLVGKAIEYGQRTLGKGVAFMQPSGPLTNTAHWIADVFSLFGVDIPSTSRSNKSHGGGASEMEALLAFRARVRSVALTGMTATDNSVAQRVLTACDSFRDKEAPRLGYTVRDVGGISTYSRATETEKDSVQ